MLAVTFKVMAGLGRGGFAGKAVNMAEAFRMYFSTAWLFHIGLLESVITSCRTSEILARC